MKNNDTRLRIIEKENGITLIALILTIIILLILAGIAIVTLTGENGLLKRANDAVEKAKEAEAVEVIELQLISCRVEYTLNSNINIPEYVEKENKEITVEVDSSLNPDNNPVGQWTMTYEGYEFEINDLQIQDYYKSGDKIKPTIKDPKVTEEYQFASINGSKADVEFKVELPAELTGATVNINYTSQATGVVNGSYDNTTGMYTGTITTDGTTNPNGTYTYEIKATKEGKNYVAKTTAKISKFLDNPKVEALANENKMDELKIKVTNGYPVDANISYKYYVSRTTYGAENFTTDTEVTKTGLKSGRKYNIKVEAYLNDSTTMVQTETTGMPAEKTIEIRYIEDLEAIKDNLTVSYKLMNDLDFKERNSYKTEDRYNYYNVDSNSDGNPDNGWETIAGTFEGKLNGESNGNIHSIYNLYSTSGGVFETIDDGIVQNIKFENVNIRNDNYDFGAITRILEELGLIERVGVSGNIRCGSAGRRYSSFV